MTLNMASLLLATVISITLVLRSGTLPEFIPDPPKIAVQSQ